jgi:hypothetical protein
MRGVKSVSTGVLCTDVQYRATCHLSSCPNKWPPLLGWISGPDSFFSSATFAVLTAKVLTASPEWTIAASGGRAVVGGRGRLSPIQIEGDTRERAVDK